MSNDNPNFEHILKINGELVECNTHTLPWKPWIPGVNNKNVSNNLKGEVLKWQEVKKDKKKKEEVENYVRGIWADTDSVAEIERRVEANFGCTISTGAVTGMCMADIGLQ